MKFAAVAVGTFGFWAALTWGFLWSQHDHFIDVQKELASQDGAYIAVVGEEWDGAGAMMGCRQFVLLRPSSKRGAAVEFPIAQLDQVFGASCGTAMSLDVIWKDSTHLEIRYAPLQKSGLFEVLRLSENVRNGVEIAVYPGV